MLTAGALAPQKAFAACNNSCIRYAFNREKRLAFRTDR